MGKAVVVNLPYDRVGILIILKVVVFLSLLFETGKAVDWSITKQLTNRTWFKKCKYNSSYTMHYCHIGSRLRPEVTTFLICPIPLDLPPAPTLPTTTSTSTPSTVTTPTTTTSTTTTTTTTTAPPTTTTMTTTIAPPTTTPGNETINPNASTTPTTSTTPTIPTTTITTATTPATTVTSSTTTGTTTTTTSRPLGPNELPHHGNKCDKPEYHNVHNRTYNLTWNMRLTMQMMKNDEDLFEPCDIYFRATKLEFPDPKYEDDYSLPYPVENRTILNNLSCNSPFSTFPTERKDLVLGLNMTEVQKRLMSLKQRRTKDRLKNITQPIECLTTFVSPYNGSWMSAIDTLPILHPYRSIPVPETCLHCPRTIAFENMITGSFFKNTYEVMKGEIVPFALKGETCSLENEAYLHGAVLASIVTDDHFGEKAEEMVEGYPWGRLHKYWPRLVNLHVADIDKDTEGKQPECTKGDYYTKLLHGDCVFNQRLATDPNEQVNGIFETYMCRGTHTHSSQIPAKLLKGEYSIPIVALGCAPYHYLMCNQEYNFNQMMESTCICHPLYAVENKNYTAIKPSGNRKMSQSQCLPMAGVPCRFNKENTEFGKLLFDYVPCAPNMVCQNLTEINLENNQNKSKWELFEKTFTGFGMSPIARDYLVSRATAMCVCAKGQPNSVEIFIQTPFNECLVPVKGGGEMIHFMQRGWLNGKEMLIGMLLVIRNIF